MPGSLREVANAEEEGVTFEWLAAPRALIGRGRRPSPACAPSACAWAPRTPRAARPRKRSTAATSTVRPSWWSRPWASSPRTCRRPGRRPDLETTRWGTVKADVRHQMTNLDGVFAAGDIVRGASLVVWAIKDGRDAADAIHQLSPRRPRPASPTPRSEGAMTEKIMRPSSDLVLCYEEPRPSDRRRTPTIPATERDACGVGLVCAHRRPAAPQRRRGWRSSRASRPCGTGARSTPTARPATAPACRSTFRRTSSGAYVRRTGLTPCAGRLAVGQVFLPRTDLGASGAPAAASPRPRSCAWATRSSAGARCR